MNIDFNVYNYNYDKRLGKIDAEAKGKVKSKKNFPYFEENNKIIIYKPLSKTKPLSTPYFAYSEVVWSNIINQFFDKKTPIYRLAKCLNYEKNEPKYHNYGTVVDSIINENEKLFNIYEYFLKYPDNHVDINNYINYCLKYYDYTFFYETQFFKSNPSLSEEVSKQILYSILRADQNYHYENLSFVLHNDNINKVASPIDHEFSTMFMYLDNKEEHDILFNKYLKQFTFELNTNHLVDIEKLFFDELFKNLTNKEKDNMKPKILRNIEIICKIHPNMVEKFIISLNNLIYSLTLNPIVLVDNNYIVPFNSYDYKIGILRYKENRYDEALKLEKEQIKKLVLVNEINKYINEEIVDTAKTLKKTLENNLNNI